MGYDVGHASGGDERQRAMRPAANGLSFANGADRHAGSKRLYPSGYRTSDKVSGEVLTVAFTVGVEIY
jgi:hypothetical protein